MIWHKVRLGSLIKHRDNRYKPNSPEIQSLKRIDKIDFTGNIFISEKPSNTEMILICRGDFVISGINVEKGAMAIYQGQENILATIHYSSYILDEDKIDVEFLKIFLRSQEFKNALKEQVPGGIKTEIKPKHILPLEVVIPSTIKEQLLFVISYNHKKTIIDSTQTALNEQIKLVKQLRETFLMEAMLGKLVPQDPSDEPASELLSRIRSKNNRLNKNKEEHTIIDKEIPYQIPNSWSWCRLSELINSNRPLTYGIVKMGAEPKNNQHGTQALRCSDVKVGKIDLSKVRLVLPEISNSYKRTILHGNEILLNIRGTLGGCAITDNRHVGFNIAREIALVVLYEAEMNHYILNLFISPYFVKEINRNLRGIAYKGLNLNILNNLLIPVPPLNEQNRIVQKLSEIMKFCDRLEEIALGVKLKNESILQQIIHESLTPEFV